MPVYRDSADSLVVHFGHGDIAISVNRPDDNSPPDEISFRAGGEAGGEIGRPYSPPEGTTTAGCAVRLVFDNPESLRVVIEELERLEAGFTIYPAVRVE
jgi:hypothetical protein